MAYTSLNFVPGEILTAAKMNLLAANDASFRDGTGFGDNTIQLSKLKLKIQSGEASATFQPDNSGGGFTVVNFPTPFAGQPTVVATPNVAHGLIAAVIITSVSKQSFTFLARHTKTTNSNGTIRWVAISENG